MDARIIEELRSWIGRTSEAEDEITPRLVEAFRATLAPHLASAGADEAPLGIHWCLAPYAAPIAELGPDGHAAKGLMLPPVPLPRRMWAGGEVEALTPLKIGDKVTRRTRIADVVAKEGRSGPLCFVMLAHEFTTARGTMLRERHDIVYRAAAEPDAPSSPSPTPKLGARPEPERSWRVETSPVLLFRYSALTFNGHRIHYDYPYVTGTEGYTGLVVHGPLQATLLLNMAAALGAKRPLRFLYRGRAPLIAGQAFHVEGRAEGGRTACWTRDAAGEICMEAETLG
jgi:3-methylfumaryl-CoA hydratase